MDLAGNSKDDNGSAQSNNTNDQHAENRPQFLPPFYPEIFFEGLKRVNELPRDAPFLIRQQLEKLSPELNLPFNSDANRGSVVLTPSISRIRESCINSPRVIRLVRHKPNAFTRGHQSYERNHNQTCSRSHDAEQLKHASAQVFKTSCPSIGDGDNRLRTQGSGLRFSISSGAFAAMNERKLFHAVATNNGPQVTKILENLRSTKSIGGYPLHLACRSGYGEIVDLLLKHGFNPNERDRLDRTPLHCAVSSMRMSIVKQLLLAGANVACMDENGNTPLKNAQVIFNIKEIYGLSEKETAEIEGLISLLQEYSKKKEESKGTIEDLSLVYSHLSLSNTMT